MANDFIVITAATRTEKLMPMYLDQLRTQKIPHHVETIHISGPSDGTLGFCLNHYRQWAEQFRSYSRLVITDGWDVLLYGTRKQIEEVLFDFPSYPIFAAERNCYPEPHLAKTIPDLGIWRFVNGGMLTASPEDLENWCNLIELHPKFDPFMIGQQWLNRRLAENDPLVKIDWKTKLFYCHFLENGELGILDGKPYNTIHETYPVFQHFNGSWPWDSFLSLMEAARV